MNTKFKIGDTVKIKETKQVGRIITLTDEGKPEFVDTGENIIRVVDNVVTLIGLLKPIIRLIISIFSKKNGRLF